MNILVTGVAGFIGYHVAKKLLERGDTVYGLDNLNEYYDVNLKKSRLNNLKDNNLFSFDQIDISNQKDIESFFKRNSICHVIHLAAQAGVRYSIQNPYAYIDSNIIGFMPVSKSLSALVVFFLPFETETSSMGNFEVVLFSKTK